jgi:hypothetical protein
MGQPRGVAHMPNSSDRFVAGLDRYAAEDRDELSIAKRGIERARRRTCLAWARGCSAPSWGNEVKLTETRGALAQAVAD